PDSRPSFQKHIARQQVAAFKQAYEDEAKNPLYLWCIYLVCRCAKIPLPDLVLEYFDRVAKELWISASQGETTRKLPEILELKGPGKTGRTTAFSRFAETDGLQDAAAVYSKMRYHKLGEDKAIKEVADEARNGAVNTVRDHWAKYKHLFTSNVS